MPFFTIFIIGDPIPPGLKSFPYLIIAVSPDGYYNVGKVIDGDTFALTDDTSDRLIGIDTPEVTI